MSVELNRAKALAEVASGMATVTMSEGEMDIGVFAKEMLETAIRLWGDGLDSTAQTAAIISLAASAVASNNWEE